MYAFKSTVNSIPFILNSETVNLTNIKIIRPSILTRVKAQHYGQLERPADMRQNAFIQFSTILESDKNYLKIISYNVPL